MNRDSAIEWTQGTWNPSTGCTKVSSGCKHCYAERQWHRFQHLPAYQGRRFSDVAVHPERLSEPLRWRKPRMVFVNSMSDLMHPAIADADVRSVIETITKADRHTFQILTKRPERLADFAPWPRNVWLGVSVEDQATADQRIPVLSRVEAAVRFLSCEPLLGPVRLNLDGIDWVIVGGESGPQAREMSPRWARDVRQQCANAGVAFFMKQMTRKAPIPADLLVREYPTTTKEAA